MDILKSLCKSLPLALLGVVVSVAFAEDECTEAKFGQMVRTNNKYVVCDPDLQSWRDATMMEASLQKSCTKKNEKEKMTVKDISLVCENDDWEGTFVDSRDNRKYAVAFIDRQIWMKENLDYEKMFGINCKQCDGYHIYDFGDAQKVCPKGWRLPSIDEWDFISRNGGIMNVANTGAFWSSSKVKESTAIKQGYAADIRWKWVDGEVGKVQRFFVLQQPLPRKNGYPVRCMTDK
ncbi:MAG: hypothetical protein II892_04810 [Fibrobacter sp.]|nr:hypothetical protein [Fibrobacter sp.]MBQ3777739.1 hypothetical protein [Fibrobacter sp.]